MSDPKVVNNIHLVKSLLEEYAMTSEEGYTVYPPDIIETCLDALESSLGVLGVPPENQSLH